MEYSDYYSEEDEDYYQSTTNEEFYRENNMDTKFKKWLNSDTDISHISSIYRLELENSNGMKSQILNENQKKAKNNENENGQEDKSEKEYEEENIGDEISEEEIKEMKSEENNTEETLEDTNNNKKNYTFIWDEGGNDVKITGSFSDWKIKFQMTKEPNNQIFKCTLPLGNEIYQYKFIVDGEWKFSKKFPTKDDGNGNINNILDNTKNEEDKSKEKSTTKMIKKPKRVSTNKTKTRDSSKKKESKKIINSNSIYQCKYPSDCILPQSLPNKRYYESFKLDNFSNQCSIGNKKYYSFYDNNRLSFGASSKSIFILGHINLNHLISTKNSGANILKNSMSFRYREKTSTFIYYK
jgi:hypothetical protein